MLKDQNSNNIAHPPPNDNVGYCMISLYNIFFLIICAIDIYAILIFSFTTSPNKINDIAIYTYCVIVSLSTLFSFVGITQCMVCCFCSDRIESNYIIITLNKIMFWCICHSFISIPLIIMLFMHIGPI